MFCTNKIGEQECKTMKVLIKDSTGTTKSFCPKCNYDELKEARGNAKVAKEAKALAKPRKSYARTAPVVPVHREPLPTLESVMGFVNNFITELKLYERHEGVRNIAEGIAQDYLAANPPKHRRPEIIAGGVVYKLTVDLDFKLKRHEGGYQARLAQMSGWTDSAIGAAYKEIEMMLADRQESISEIAEGKETTTKTETWSAPPSKFVLQGIYNEIHQIGTSCGTTPLVIAKAQQQAREWYEKDPDIDEGPKVFGSAALWHTTLREKAPIDSGLLEKRSGISRKDFQACRRKLVKKFEVSEYKIPHTLSNNRILEFLPDTKIGLENAFIVCHYPTAYGFKLEAYSGRLLQLDPVEDSTRIAHIIPPGRILVARFVDARPDSSDKEYHAITKEAGKFAQHKVFPDGIFHYTGTGNIDRVDYTAKGQAFAFPQSIIKVSGIGALRDLRYSFEAKRKFDGNENRELVSIILRELEIKR